MNNNQIQADSARRVLFVDMNSFFASCEQQENYWLRGRPVAVCVYTGKFGCIISPSVEAKRHGIKTGMRLNDAVKLCPELIPLETKPQRYREFHNKIIKVLKRYSENVIPKSIDEAIVDISDYALIYKDPVVLAKTIKQDIKTDVGDWLKCSIGIAPNAFLAKLGSNIQKPDGLTCIFPENIDEVLKKLSLRDLPGIARGMSDRLAKGGISTPLELRYARPDIIKTACKSVVGLYWHMRLNFSEVDMISHDYKSMQAMRHLSRDQRQSTTYMVDLMQALCMKLEKRMVQQEVFCQEISVFLRFENGHSWSEHVKNGRPLQDGMEVYKIICERMKKFENINSIKSLLNESVISLGVTVYSFISDELIQYNMFEDNVRKDRLRKVVYDIKNRFGTDKVMKAAELHDETILEDVIGFGSIKDIHDDLHKIA